jgi:2-amino-4-hydroxy-6-hydroxymethyldihydropteridine diphosphokinase
MVQTLISFGANLGNSRQLIQLAGKHVVEKFGSQQVAFSRMYRAPAVGGPSGQADFYNAVATIDSDLSAFEVWQALQIIEQNLGRQRRLRWEARRIDLDVLLHGRERHWTPKLKIPHPRMCLRTFVLEPASEIAARWIEPVTGMAIEQLRDELRALSGSHASPPHVLLLADQQSILDALKVSMEADSRSLPFGVVEPLLLSRASRAASLQTVLEMREEIAQRFISLTDKSIRLIVFAGTTPDPTAVHWEDYGRIWAELFGMNRRLRFEELPSSIAEQQFRRIPKYLLSADDPDWAAHELRAAIIAMTCPVRACGEFFDAE